ARTPDQVLRLRRVFIVRRELRLRGNLVVHARLPRSGEQIEQEEQEGTYGRRRSGRATLGGGGSSREEPAAARRGCKGARLAYPLAHACAVRRAHRGRARGHARGRARTGLVAA